MGVGGISRQMHRESHTAVVLPWPAGHPCRAAILGAGGTDERVIGAFTMDQRRDTVVREGSAPCPAAAGCNAAISATPTVSFSGLSTLWMYTLMRVTAVDRGASRPMSSMAGGIVAMSRIWCSRTPRVSRSDPLPGCPGALDTTERHCRKASRNSGHDTVFRALGRMNPMCAFSGHGNG